MRIDFNKQIEGFKLTPYLTRKTTELVGEEHLEKQTYDLGGIESYCVGQLGLRFTNFGAEFIRSGDSSLWLKTPYQGSLRLEGRVFGQSSNSVLEEENNSILEKPVKAEHPLVEVTGNISYGIGKDVDPKLALRILDISGYDTTIISSREELEKEFEEKQSRKKAQGKGGKERKKVGIIPRQPNVKEILSIQRNMAIDTEIRLAEAFKREAQSVSKSDDYDCCYPMLF
jgi:hypothetical protein